MWLVHSLPFLKGQLIITSPPFLQRKQLMITPYAPTKLHYTISNVQWLFICPIAHFPMYKQVVSFKTSQIPNSFSLSPFDINLKWLGYLLYEHSPLKRIS